MDKKKLLVMQKSKGKCAHCGKALKEKVLTFDHVFPKSLGGTLATDNVIGLCKACNQAKAAKLVDIYKFYKYANKSAKEAALNYSKNILTNSYSKEDLNETFKVYIKMNKLAISV